jgi:radical SAM-linked protein
MKVRFRFGKSGKVRFTSHRDVARMWERAFRRSEFPVMYTAGFSPRPKISFGLALPTGCESDAEYLDVETEDRPHFDADDLSRRLSDALPAGVEITAAGVLPERGDSLQEAVIACTWRVGITAIAPDELQALVTRALAAETLQVQRQRKGKDVIDDVRPAVETLVMAGPTPFGAELVAELRTQPRGVRPPELLAALGDGLVATEVRRLHQWIERDGARIEPEADCLPFGATSAPHAEARAS